MTITERITILPELTTERLTLREARFADLGTLWTLWSDPDVRRFLFDDESISLARARAIFSETRSHASKGLGLWIVESRDEGRFIGCVGLMPVTTAAEYEPRFQGEVEPLVAIAPTSWRQGYAREALMEMARHAFETLGMARLVAAVDLPNHASRALVATVGFRRFSEVSGPRYRLRTYAMTPAAFRRT